MGNGNYHLEADPSDGRFLRMVSDREHVIRTFRGSLTIGAGERGGSMEKSVKISDPEGKLWMDEESRAEGESEIFLDPEKGDQILVCSSLLRNCRLSGGFSLLFGVFAEGSAFQGSLDLFAPCPERGTYAIRVLSSRLATENSFAMIYTASCEEGAVEITGSDLQEFALLSGQSPGERGMRIVVRDSRIRASELAVSDPGRCAFLIRSEATDSILCNSSLTDSRVVHTVGKRIRREGVRIGNPRAKKRILPSLDPGEGA